eukprot:scaffold48628_cov54-Phaeocystis_antarctica.AAC.1
MADGSEAEHSIASLGDTSCGIRLRVRTPPSTLRPASPVRGTLLSPRTPPRRAEPNFPYRDAVSSAPSSRFGLNTGRLPSGRPSGEGGGASHSILRVAVSVVDGHRAVLVVALNNAWEPAALLWEVGFHALAHLEREGRGQGSCRLVLWRLPVLTQRPGLPPPGLYAQVSHHRGIIVVGHRVCSSAGTASN